jgi:hypothetical protein
MERNHCPISPNGEPGFGFSSSTGSSPDIDLSAAPGLSSAESDGGQLNWESDWIDLGGEG